MYIQYVTFKGAHRSPWGAVCRPTSERLDISLWHATECEWMIPGTFNE